jgi:hypothetical protein
VKDLDAVRQHALFLVESGRRAAVRDYLQAQRVRFESLAAEEQLKTLMEVLGR